MIGRRVLAGQRFVLVAVVTALVLLCAPVTPMTPLVVRARLAAPPIVMTGTSVIRHASKCDADARSIAAMLAGLRGEAVLDLSYSGQSLSDSVNLAAVSLRNPHVRTVLLTISIFAMMEQDMVSLRDYAAFRLINPFLPSESLEHRLFARSDQSGLAGPMQDAFSYGGVDYPAYDQLKTRFLQPERDAMTCPESDGLNQRFVTALYYHTYLQYPLLPANITLLTRLGQEAARRGKDFRAVLLPIDGEQIQALLPGDAARVQDQAQALVRQLSQAGMTVLDLSAAVPNGGFADRWCACGHLQEAGRRDVAEQINTSVRTKPMTTVTAAD